MNEEIKAKLNNVLKAEAEYTMKNETNTNVKLEKMNTLFNLKKIIDNYDELEHVLVDYFNKKAEKERFDR